MVVKDGRSTAVTAANILIAVGTGATELIHIDQAVLGLRGGLDYFLSTAFN